MSLDYDNTKLSKPVEESEQAEHYVMCVYMMVLGVPDVDEKNWPTLYTRMYTYERLTGAGLIRNGKPYYFTEDMVKRWIGLHTNVSKKTHAQFMKVISNVVSDYEKKIRRNIDNPEKV